MQYLSEILPSERRAPASVLAALRAIDPAADLIYLGEGEWWLGVMAPNQHRARTGYAIAVREWARPHPRWEQLRFAACAQYGFAYIQTVYGEPDGAAVERFREADWMYRHEQPAFDEFLINAPEAEMNHSHHSFLKSRAAADLRALAERVKRRRPIYTSSLN